MTIVTYKWKDNLGLEKCAVNTLCIAIKTQVVYKNKSVKSWVNNNLEMIFPDHVRRVSYFSQLILEILNTFTDVPNCFPKFGQQYLAHSGEHHINRRRTPLIQINNDRIHI